MVKKAKTHEKIAYFLFEGDTEEVFYKAVLDKYLNKGIKRKYKNLETGCGINREVAKHIAYFLRENPQVDLYVYVFLDREGLRSTTPEFNSKEIKKALASKQIKQLEKIEAIKMIESWFLYDLENICHHIGLKYTRELQNKYQNPEAYGHKDLNELFKKGITKCRYKKGDEKFLKCLNIETIYNKCEDLRNGMAMINEDFKEVI